MKITLKAEKEIAFDSPDHIAPWGTRKDNSRNRRFNSKMYSFYPSTKELKILDLGCAGGGFVKDCLDAGHLAVGLEGSDWSKKHKRAEWAYIPNFLFTCDITGDFEILDEDSAVINFDFITAWEVMEHIKTEGIPKIISNVKKHLLPTGLWILSVSEGPNFIDGINLHQTTQPRSWWLSLFQSFGFTQMEDITKYFNNQFIRGGERDNSQIFVLSLDSRQAPMIPKLKISDYIFDKWYGSAPQKLLKRIII